MVEGSGLAFSVVDALASEVTPRAELDFEEFCALIDLVDQAVEGAESGLEATEQPADVDLEDDEGISEAELLELNRAAFKELASPDSGLVSVADFKAWDDIQDLIGDGVLRTEDVDAILASVGAASGSLNFEQFNQAVQQVDAAAEQFLEMDGFSEDDENDEEEAMDSSNEESFEALASGSGRVSVAAFKDWEEVREIVDLGLVDESDIDEALRAAAVDFAEGMTLEQFKKAISILNDGPGEFEGEDDGDDELDESTIRDMAKSNFAKLKGPNDRVSIEGFQNWAEVRNMVSDELVTLDDINSVMEAVGVDEDGMDLEQFTEALLALDEIANETAEDEDGVLAETFDALKSPNGKVTRSAFLAWDEVRELVSDEVLSKGEIDAILDELGVDADGMDLDTFTAAVERLDEAAAGADGLGEGEVEDTQVSFISETRNVDALRDLFAELRSPKTKKVPVQLFLKWSELDALFKRGVLDDEIVRILVAEVDSEIDGELTFEQFQAFINMIDQLARASDESNPKVETRMTGAGSAEDKDLSENSDATSTSSEDDESDDDFDELSAEELEAISREAFDELKSKNGKVSVKRFMAWESIAEALEEGEITKEDVETALAKAGVGKSGDMDFEAFKRVVEIVEDTTLLSDEQSEGPPAQLSGSSGKGFGRTPSPQKLNSDLNSEKPPGDDEAASISNALFDELRGKRKTIPLEDFRKWDELNEMINSGSLKLSTLEKALKSTGCLDTEEITRSQFTRIMDSISAGADLSQALEDAAGEGVEFEDTEEEMARGIYDQLRGKKPTLQLTDFLKWDDVQELLQCGAITKDQLATAVDGVGVSVEKGDISFDQFFDLISIMDDFIDKDKIPQEDGDADVPAVERRIVVDKGTRVEDVMGIVDKFVDSPGATKVSYKNSKGARSEGIEALNALSEDFDDDDDALDEEALEMVCAFLIDCGCPSLKYIPSLRSWRREKTTFSRRT